MKEAGVILDLAGNPIYWHLPNDRSGGALPDSQELWKVFWENRDNISGFAHSHPGFGPTGPSLTDLTTFSAIRQGLGKKLDWWIVNGNNMILVRWTGPDKLDYTQLDVCMNPLWAEELRQHSNYKR